MLGNNIRQKSHVYTSQCKLMWRVSKGLFHLRAKRLIDRTWCGCEPSFPASPPLSRFPHSCPPPALSLSPSSLAALRSQTRHRQQGCSEGAAQPENGTTTRPVDLSIPSPPVLPHSFSRVVAVSSPTELPGEWRWVSLLVVWALSEVRGRCLGCALCWRMGSSMPRVHSPGKERSGAAENPVKCSAPLWILHNERWGEREGGNCWSRFSFLGILALNLYDRYTASSWWW